MTEEKKTKTGILLMAFGAMSDMSNAYDYLKCVLKERPEALNDELVEDLKDRYSQIGGKSPLLDITKKQAALLEEELKTQGKDVKVYVGMRNWHPFIDEAVKDMWADGIEKGAYIIMAPHATMVPARGYVEDLDHALRKTSSVPHLKETEFWHLNKNLIQAIAGNIQDEIVNSDIDSKDMRILFSAHSLPVPAVRFDENNYTIKIEETSKAVFELLKNDFSFEGDFKVCYQSQGGGSVGWIGPKTDDEIKIAKEEDKKAVIISPVGFVCDHIETLYDIDIYLKNVAKEAGITFLRAKSLNENPLFIKALSEAVKDII